MKPQTPPTLVLAVVCTLAALLVASCTVSDDADCISDEDCLEDQRCASAGGLFARDGVCIERDLEDNDDNVNNKTEPEDCAAVRPRGLATDQPAAVSTLLEVTDCETGQPRPEFELDDFELAEDEQRLDDPELVRDWTETGHRTYVTVLIDMSDDAYDSRHSIVSAVNNFVDRLLTEADGADVRVGIELFDGSETLTSWQLPIGDADRLEERVDDIIGNFDPPGTGETNFRGGVYQAVTGLQQRLRTVRSLHDDGVTTRGHLVAFAATADTLDARPAGEVSDAVTGASTFDAENPETPLVASRAVVLEEADPEGAIEIFGADRVVQTDASDLNETLGQTGEQLAETIEATHLITHCSAMRSDDHTLTIEVTDQEVTSEPLSVPFSAADFEEGCDAGFLDGACQDLECGGLHCGGCDDQTAVCGGGEATGACVDYCRAGDQCHRGDVTNALGYDQQCELEDGWATCEASCIDTSTNTDHCGACNNHCPPDVPCEDGVCSCEDDLVGCFGECFDLDVADDHCGACGNECDVRCSGAECITVEDVTVGAGHTCAVLEDGTAECWGDNEYGQLGDGESGTQRSEPAPVEGLTDVTGIYPGYDHTCAIADDTLYCWGDNQSGQLGDGTTTDSPTFVAVQDDAFDAPLTDVVLGDSHTCALDDDGNAYCWGDDDRRQLGQPEDVSDNGDDDTNSPLLVEVFEDDEVRQLAAGDKHTCAVVAPEGPDGLDANLGNELYCWGLNGNGQVGHEETGNRGPTHVEDIEDVREVVTGSTHTCALDQEGEVGCWGRTTRGRLGVGEDYEFNSPLIQYEPIPIEDLPEIARLIAAERATCAVDTGGQYHCWGISEDGIFGVMDLTFYSPARIDEFDDSPGLSMGGEHVCRIVDGRPECRGANSDGQLGDTTTDPRPSFTPVVWH